MREYLMIAGLIAMLIAALGIDRAAYKRGAKDGDNRATAADARATNAESALQVAMEANIEAHDVLLLLKSRLEQCNAERVYDVTVARAAASAAQADVDRIEQDHMAMRAKMFAHQSGECRDWAAAPACGSYP